MAISILETKYEETEDPIIERQFIIANANLARLKLALGDYKGSLETFESVLGLLGEEDLSNVDPALVTLRVEAQFLSGLAHFKLGQVNDAVDLLESAVQSGASRMDLVRQVTVVLAQVLWASGSPEAQEAAKNRLLEW